MKLISIAVGLFVFLFVAYTISLYYMKLPGTLKKGKDKEVNWSSLLLLSLVMSAFTFVMSAIGAFILKRTTQKQE